MKVRVDARGRHAPRLLPHRLGRAPRGRPRQERQGDRLAASQRRADASCRPSTPDAKHEAPFELGMGLVDMPFDVRQHAHARTRRPRRTRASAGSARSRTSRTPSRCSRSSPSSRSRRARSEGLPARADRPAAHRRARKTLKDLWNYGEPLDSYPSTPARLRKVVELVAEKARLGHASCRRATASASPRTAASSATSRRSSRSRSTTRARSRSRASTSRSTAAPIVNPERVRSQMEGAASWG